MTTKRIVYSRPDGGVSVVCPAPAYIAQLMAGGATEDEAITAVQAKDVPPDATNIEVMELASLPSNREFRNAWEKPGAGVPTVAMSKARDIHAERMAHVQVAEIARLKVEERKERLNDNTAQADAHAATVIALEALDLNVLATQIAAAPNPTALAAVWPVLVPRPT